MLESKYLTQTGVIEMLQHIYNQGFKYIFYNSDRNIFQASQQKPYFENGEFEYCTGFKNDFVDGFSTKVLEDLLCGHNYIDIIEQLNIVDWSTVKVDTPVYVRDKEDTTWYRRYFAKYENNTVYMFPYGTTQWSSNGRNLVTYDQIKLAE